MNGKFSKDIIWTKNVENKISTIVSNIADSYSKKDSISHTHKYPLPSKTTIISIIKDLFYIIYPGYFTEKEFNKTNINYFIGDKVTNIFEKLSVEISKSFRHEHVIKNNVCELCDDSIKKRNRCFIIFT